MRLVSPANGTGTHRQSQGGWVEGLWVPAGVTGAVDQYTIQRSPKCWKYPEEYHPERWFPENRAPHAGGSDFEHDDHAAYRPFLLWPRACFGRELGL